MVLYSSLKYCKLPLLSKLQFLSENITVSSETSLLFPVYYLTSHCWPACRQKAMPPVGKDTYAGWVTGSLYNNVTGMFF